MLYKLIFEKGLAFPKNNKDFFVLFLSGAAIGFNWILLFQAYRFTSVSKATLSYYFAPIIVIIASPIIFREKLTIKQIVCFIMATIGLTMIVGIGGSGMFNDDLTGILYGLGAATFYATVILLNKFIKTVDGIDKTFVQFIGSIIVLVPYVLTTSGLNLTGLDYSATINLIVLGVFHTGITYCLFFSSLKELAGQEASILSYIDPLVAIIISVTVFREAITPVQIMGGMLILGFSLYNELDISFMNLIKNLFVRGHVRRASNTTETAE